MVSIKVQSNFIEIILWHRSSPVNLMYISKVLFPLNGCSCNLDQSKTAPALETESHKIDDDITKSTNLPNEAPQIPI